MNILPMPPDRSAIGVRTPSFTLSLDCEGKWGVADSTAPWVNAINTRSLDAAYQFIFDTLDRHDVRATFAFTSLFGAPRDLVHERLDEIESSALMSDSWYRAVVQRSRADGQDGWNGERYLTQARAAGHEIGWHGYTHHVLAPDVDDAVADFEFSQAATLAREQGLQYQSAVYPRNGVGHVGKLGLLGIRCHRRSAADPRRGRSVLASLKRIGAEFDITGSLGIDTHGERVDGQVALPPGNFLYWPLGARKLVPPAITIRRWRAMLRRGADQGWDTHMWFHPHNLITAPAMRETFAAVIRSVGEMQRRGQLQSRTMQDIGERYCRE
ncbi:MAG: hypothetical protein CFE44_09190 [Burkholderiales bacterium PBB4]|nr:MAG: hypothetical protein CFE44_09190 [Burkholderiales bacterium PBB4]